MGASAPEIKAVARAGSTIEVKWTPVVAGHVGPVMSVRRLHITAKVPS